MALLRKPRRGPRGLVAGLALVALGTFGIGPAAWTALAAEPANAPSERGVIPEVLDTGDANPDDECRSLTGLQDVGAMQIAGEAGGFPAGSPYTEGSLQVTISDWDATAKSFDWAATVPVLGVWVKGGSGGEGNWYDYSTFSDRSPGPGADRDGDLHTKPNPNGPAGLSHVTLCYSQASAGAPDLTVDKTSDTVAPLSPGDTIAYSIHVSNIGDADAHDVVATDALPPGVSLTATPAGCSDGGDALACALGTIVAGGQATIELTVTVDATTCGDLTNAVSVRASDEPAGNVDDANHDDLTDTVECAASDQPDLVMDKTSNASGALPRGHGIVYELTVTNVGDATAAGIHIQDDVPPGLRIMGALPTMQGGTCSAIGTVDSDGNQFYAIDCVRAALAAGASATATIHMQVDADARCGRLVNTASVAGGNEPKARRDAHNHDTVTDRVACTPSIALQTRGPSLAHAGEEVMYTFRASNDGERPLVDVQLHDAGCEASLRRIGHGNGDDTLARGETWIYRCTHAISGADGDPALNTATVHAADRDGIVVHDTARNSVDVLHPDIALVKSASAASGEAGSPITFSYAVTNTGDTPLFDVRVDDDVLGAVGEIPSIQPGASRTLTASGVLPSAAAPMTAIGSASGRDALGASVADHDAVTVTVLAASSGGSGHHGGSAFTGAQMQSAAAIAVVLLALGIGATATARRGRGGGTKA